MIYLPSLFPRISNGWLLGFPLNCNLSMFSLVTSIRYQRNSVMSFNTTEFIITEYVWKRKIDFFKVTLTSDVISGYCFLGLKFQVFTGNRNRTSGGVVSNATGYPSSLNYYFYFAWFQIILFVELVIDLRLNVLFKIW